MRLPTVRVVSHGGLTYTTINVADLLPHHKLWDEQEPGFVPPAAQPLVSSMGTAQIELAASLMQRMIAAGLDYQLADYQALSAAERIEHLREAEREFDARMAAAAEERRLAFEATHVAGDVAAAAGDASPRVTKGPRGFWYGYRGDERITSGYPTEEEARKAMTLVDA